MDKELKFKIGDGVTVTTGALKDIYGTVVFYDEKTDQYLVRFTGSQQMFFSEADIVYWDK
jgi:transcription antitermination factor NusG